MKYHKSVFQVDNFMNKMKYICSHIYVYFQYIYTYRFRVKDD